MYLWDFEICLAQITKLVFFGLSLNPSNYCPTHTDSDWSSWCLPWETCSSPISKKLRWECSAGCLWPPLGTNCREILQLGCPAMNNLDPIFFVQNLLPPPSTKDKYIKTAWIERDLSSVLVEINHDIVLLLLCTVNSEKSSARSWNPSVRLLKGALKIDFSTCKWATKMTRNSCCLFNTCLP